MWVTVTPGSRPLQLAAFVEVGDPVGRDHLRSRRRVCQGDESAWDLSAGPVRSRRRYLPLRGLGQRNHESATSTSAMVVWVRMR
jgi:hypothetical protein